MSRWTSRSLLLAALLTGTHAAAERDPLAALENAQQALFEAAAPAVVFIGAKRGFGSGFFVSEDGLILTNLHVVKDAQEVDVVLHDGRKLRARVVERAADEIDLALLRLLEPQRTPRLRLADGRSLRVGAWVAAIGHGLGGIWTFSTGMVSNIYPSGATRPVFQTQIPLNPGNSGGPIFDRGGKVVGVVTAGIQEANNVNFGIQIEVAFKSLEQLAPHCDCLVIRAPSGTPIFVNGQMAGKGPLLVVPARAEDYEVFLVHQGKMLKQKVRFPAVREVKLGL